MAFFNVMGGFSVLFDVSMDISQGSLSKLERSGLRHNTKLISCGKRVFNHGKSVPNNKDSNV